jgi:hypothetical protein
LFWIRKDSNSLTQFQVGGVDDVFSNQFQSVYDNTPSGVLRLPFSLCSDTSSLASVKDESAKLSSYCDQQNLSDWMIFLIQLLGYFCTFTCFLTLVCPRRHFLLHGKKQPLSRFFLKKKGNKASVTNYR